MSKHKKKLLCIISFAVVVNISFAHAKIVLADENFRAAKIKSFSGKVKIGKGGGEKTFDAIEGMSLVEGDNITTEKDSSVLLYIDDDKEVEIGDNSIVNLSELSGYMESDDQKTGISLWIGKIFSNIKKKLKIRSKYEIKVPTAVMGVRGTEFSVESSPEGDIDVIVLEGTVTALRTLAYGPEKYTAFEVTITKNQSASMNQHDESQNDVIVTEIKASEVSLFGLEILKDFIEKNPESVDENTKNEINTEIDKRIVEKSAMEEGTNDDSEIEKPSIKIDPIVEENMVLNNVMSLANSEVQNMQPENVQTEGEQGNQFLQTTLNGAAEQVPTQQETPPPSPEQLSMQQRMPPPEQQVPTQPIPEQVPTRPIPTEPPLEQVPTQPIPIEPPPEQVSAQHETTQPVPEQVPTQPIPTASTGWISNVVKTGSEYSTINFAAQDFNSQFTNMESYSLSAIKITSLPSYGTLMIDTVPVVVNQEIKATDLAKLTFVSDINWSGTTSFDWIGSKGISSESNEATVSIKVTPVNDAPTVENYNVETEYSTNASGIIAASDVDGDTLTYDITTAAGHGTATVDLATGAWKYIPEQIFSGTDSFGVTVSDGNGGSVISTVTVTVMPQVPPPVNTAPTAQNRSETIFKGTSMYGLFTVTNSDINTVLTYTVTSQPTNGVVTVNSNGSYIYTPNANYSGMDSFKFKANDGTTDSNEATVSIAVMPVNNVPIVQNYSVETEYNTKASGTISALDMDGDTLRYAVTTTAVAVYGTATVDSTTGKWEYTPSQNFSGTDSFVVTVSDEKGGSAASIVTVTVKPEVNVTTPTAAIINLQGGNQGENLYFDDTPRLFFDDDIVLPTDLSKIEIKYTNGNAVPITEVSIIDVSGLELYCPSMSDGQYTISIPAGVISNTTGTKYNGVINLPFTVDLQGLKSILSSDITEAENWASTPVGNNATQCSSQAAIDELNVAIADAQNIMLKTYTTIDEIYGATNTLKNAVEQVKNNIVNTLMVFTVSGDGSVSANSTFDEVITVEPNIGTFLSDLSSSNIILGGDFKNLIIKSVSVPVSNNYYIAQIELSGELSRSTGFGTITINAAGWESTVNSKDITASIVVK